MGLRKKLKGMLSKEDPATNAMPGALLPEVRVHNSVDSDSYRSHGPASSPLVRSRPQTPMSSSPSVPESRYIVPNRNLNANHSSASPSRSPVSFQPDRGITARYADHGEYVRTIGRPRVHPPNGPVPLMSTHSPSGGPLQLVVVGPLEDSESDDVSPRLLSSADSNLSVGPTHGGKDFRAPSPFATHRQSRLFVNYDSDSSDGSPPSPPDIRHTQRVPAYQTAGGRLAAGDRTIYHGSRNGSTSSFRSTQEESNEPNFNRRYDYLPQSMVPFWYNKDVPPTPELKGTHHYLCATCRRIGLLALFKQQETNVMPKPRDYIVLGSLSSLLQRKECGFCSLVLRVIVADTTADLPASMNEEERKEVQVTRVSDLMEETHYLCPIRFETTFNEPTLYICSGKDIKEAAKKTSLTRPRGSMAIRPIVRDVPNLGRILLEPQQMDFGWIRERMRLCDERDVGKLDYQHKINVRALDVHSMRIVNLYHGDRYAALSYTWGDVEQVGLETHNEQMFRSGGLARLWNRVPKTIQDAVKLVRGIGERYLWVDCLCILQDDAEDMKQQIGEMGSIYTNAILTICACCGNDANYGLPGVDAGTRRTRQVAGVVGKMVVGNNVGNSDANEEVMWDKRGWTLQEKVLSQRKLKVFDTHVHWWCWHTLTDEDQNCQHTWWEPGTKHHWMYFFRTEHDLVVSKIAKNSNMDVYAFIVSDYTRRELKFQSDAENAVTGALNAIKSIFRGKFIAGLPDTEFCAGLLWSPLGSCKRRVDAATGRPLFPSWSWLGWAGPVAYPWLIERTMPMSEDGSPLIWEDAYTYRDDDVDEHGVKRVPEWFTGEEYRMNDMDKPKGLLRRWAERDGWTLDESDGWTHIDKDTPSHRWLHPINRRFVDRFWLCSGPDSFRLRLCSLSAHFRLDSRVRPRREKHDYVHTVHQVRVLDARGFCAGYIDVPDPATFSSQAEQNSYVGNGSHHDEPREFIVLSRASTNPDPRIGAELLHTTPLHELHSVYSTAYLVGAMERLRPSDGEGESEGEVDEQGHFDTRLYDATMPWGMFNVMMIRRVRGVANRVAIGRIHVAAFMEAGAALEVFDLE